MQLSIHVRPLLKDYAFLTEISFAKESRFLPQEGKWVFLGQVSEMFHWEQPQKSFLFHSLFLTQPNFIFITAFSNVISITHPLKSI